MKAAAMKQFFKLKIKAKKSLIFFSLFLTGCMVGPNYQKPIAQTPEKFSEVKTSSKNTSLASWWERFNDPYLNELVQKAISNNYDLRIAVEKVEESRDFYKIEKAKLFPEFDATAQALRADISKNLFTNPLLVSIFNFFHVGFDAIWEIDVFGKQRRLKEAASYGIGVQEEEVHDAYISVLSDVARYYIDIRAFKELSDLTKKNVELRKKYLVLIENRETSGIDSSIPVEEEIASLESSENELLSLETSLKQRIYQLAILLGSEPEKFIETFPVENSLPSFDGTIPDLLPSTLLRSRPDIRKAERQLAVSTALIGSAIADFFPSFSLTNTRIGLDSSVLRKLFQSNSTTWILGSLMNWPAITFGRVSAEVAAKKSEQKQALLTYEKTVLNALQDVEGAFVAYYNQENILSKTELALGAIERKTKLYQDQYKSGLINELSYIKQQENLIESQKNEISAKRLLYTNAIALYKALGGNDW